MAWYRAGGGGGGVPASLKTDMNAVFNKKFGTSTDYPPTAWPDTVNIMGPLPKGKASGAIAHITDGADDVPCASCEVTIEPTLTGVSSVSVVRQGKNLFDKNNPNEVDGYFTTTGFSTGNANAKTIYIPIVGGITYTVSKTAGQKFQIATAEVIPTNNALFTDRQAGNTNTSLTITASTNDKYLWAWVFLDGTDSGTLSEMLASIQIEVGSTSSAYEAYNGTTYTASLGRTIYGGKVDIVNGTGTDITTRIQIKDRAWTREAVNDFYVFVTTGITAKALNYNFVCEGYTNAQTYRSNLQDKQIGTYNNTSGRNRFAIRDDSYTNADDFIEAVGDNYIVFENNTPTDFTFTGVEVPTRYGVNNFFSNSGDTSVEYRKDIGLAIGLNKYRYLKWKISATRTTSSYCQMSDIEFSDANGSKFTFPTGTTVTASTSATSGSSPAYIVDGNTATKFCGNWVTGGITINIDLGMGNVLDVSVFKNFSWYTANDATDRDPKTWELYGIDNANNEILLCSRTDFTPTTDRKALADTVTITPLE